MSDPQIAENADRPNLNRAWATGMAIVFCGMAALAAWIWKDLDHRIDAAKALEAKTGKAVGPDPKPPPRAAAVTKPADVPQ